LVRGVKGLFRKLFQSRADQTAAWTPVSDEQFRSNVIENCRRTAAQRRAHLPDLLQSDPPLHPGDLSYQLGKLSGDLLQLAMIDWRDGSDPRPHLAEIQQHWTAALSVRPDILSAEYRDDFLCVISDLLGWDIPFNREPPGDDLHTFDMKWMERWINAGLADPSCWPLKAKAPRAKNTFINKCLDDYWALLTDQIDPDASDIPGLADPLLRRAVQRAFRGLHACRDPQEARPDLWHRPRLGLGLRAHRPIFPL
jgi:hypothetical protein